MSKNILFLTEQTFKERTGASNSIDGKQIFPMIKVAGDMYIQPALGSRLYRRLQDGVEVGIREADNCLGSAGGTGAWSAALIDDHNAASGLRYFERD